MLLNHKKRQGAISVEAAVVYPIVFLIVFGIILIGTAVFHYQQVAHIAREASRWASVHGELYAEENNTSSASAADVYEKAIKPIAVSMKIQGISYSVVWDNDAEGNPYQSPTRSVIYTDSYSGQNAYRWLSNTVSVTVTYTWNTGLFGSFPVSATSVNTISY